MAAPSWLTGALACVMIATSAYCLSRLVISWRRQQPAERDVDAVHVLMGVAMAGMLVPRLRLSWTGGWEVVFGAAAAWFAWRAIGGPGRAAAAGRQHAHHAQHLLACLAMLYMLAAATGAGAADPARGAGPAGVMTGGSGRVPTVALVLALALFGYVVWTADRLTSLASVAAAAGRRQGLQLTAAVAPAGGSGHRPAGPVPAGPAAPAGPASAGPASAGQRAAPPISPRLAAWCEIAMGLTMGYMLITML